eukprot:TRINITY_DN41522_c0_g2_i1.p1 TRINITY_DN41522_c0_g2~~TRINITY_DN41522_c0_g2_i1.p1  ORF type:complete len:170 (-),score=34.79 TRINITY_DN41522_c0_g2_i1:185-694(-)
MCLATPQYCLVYTVLCGLNFFFDALPLVTEVGGRVSRTTTPVNVTTSQHVTQTTWEITTEVTPFFDRNEGFMYNVQSAAMIVSPLTLALGLYVSMVVSTEIAAVLENMPPGAGAELERDANAADGEASAATRPANDSSTGRTSRTSRSPTTLARQTFERFLGRGQKLPS